MASSDLGTNFGEAHVALRRSSHVKRLIENFYKNARGRTVTNVKFSEPIEFDGAWHLYIEWDHTAVNGYRERSNVVHDGTRAINDALGGDIFPVICDVRDRAPRLVHA